MRYINFSTCTLQHCAQCTFLLQWVGHKNKDCTWCSCWTEASQRWGKVCKVWHPQIIPKVPQNFFCVKPIFCFVFENKDRLTCIWDCLEKAIYNEWRIYKTHSSYVRPFIIWITYHIPHQLLEILLPFLYLNSDDLQGH